MRFKFATVVLCIEVLALLGQAPIIYLCTEFPGSNMLRFKSQSKKNRSTISAYRRNYNLCSDNQSRNKLHNICGNICGKMMMYRSAINLFWSAATPSYTLISVLTKPSSSHMNHLEFLTQKTPGGSNNELRCSSSNSDLFCSPNSKAFLVYSSKKLTNREA